MSKDDYPITKSDLDRSHSAIAKTVSAYGSEVKKNNDEIIDLKRMVKDFIDRADKVLDANERDIDDLKKSDTEIRSTFNGGKWMASVSAVIILGLIGTITTLGYNIYLRDLEAITVKIDKIQAQTK